MDQKSRVLVVDDAEGARVSLEYILADAGYSAQIPVRYFYKRTRPDI